MDHTYINSLPLAGHVLKADGDLPLLFALHSAFAIPKPVMYALYVLRAGFR